jgi:hypothetical protein
MDPTGGWGFKLLIALIVAVGLLWWLAPFAWALGISLALGAGFVIFIVSIFSSARFS